jgi:hypothetical protein
MITTEKDAQYELRRKLKARHRLSTLLVVVNLGLIAVIVYQVLLLIKEFF